MQGCHEHCRDWYEDHKETIKHVLDVCSDLGISAIVDEPNTDPPIVSRGLARLRLRGAYNCYSKVHYRLLMGVTSDPGQIKEAVECVREYFPFGGKRIGIVGLKLFAGKSVGDLSVIEPNLQRRVFRTLAGLDYRGFIACHDEKEGEMNPKLWDPRNPITHCYARPEKAEIESHKDIIRFAIEEGFKGHLHLYHVTTPESVRLVQEAKKFLNITCGATPHHLLLYDEMMNRERGICLKVNPPLRPKKTQEALFEDFKNGKIDVLETDHAPHELPEKTGEALDEPGKPVYMSGIPWIHLLPEAIQILMKRGVSSDLIERVSHDNIDSILETKTPRINPISWVREGDPRDFYAFNPLEFLEG